MRRFLIALVALAAAASAARAQSTPTQLLCKDVAIGTGVSYRTTGTADLERFIGGAWLITAQFDDTTLARKAAISFQIEVRDDEGQWYAWDADNSQDRRDGFFVAARGDSSWLMATTGSTGDNVTPTASGPAYPWKVPSLRYMSDDESGAGQTNLATPGWPSALTRRWAVPFADAFGNAQWFPGRVRLIVTNRSPSAAIKLLTIKAKGQRAY